MPSLQPNDMLFAHQRRKNCRKASDSNSSSPALWRHLLYATVTVMSTFMLLQPSVADLPSCVRAKCSHCNVPFIAQMCPAACVNCPKPSAPVAKSTVIKQPLLQQQQATDPGQHKAGFGGIKVTAREQLPNKNSAQQMLPKNTFSDIDAAATLRQQITVNSQQQQAQLNKDSGFVALGAPVAKQLPSLEAQFQQIDPSQQPFTQQQQQQQQSQLNQQPQQFSLPQAQLQSQSQQQQPLTHQQQFLPMPFDPLMVGQNFPQQQSQPQLQQPMSVFPHQQQLPQQQFSLNPQQQQQQHGTVFFLPQHQQPPQQVAAGGAQQQQSLQQQRPFQTDEHLQQQQAPGGIFAAPQIAQHQPQQKSQQSASTTVTSFGGVYNGNSRELSPQRAQQLPVGQQVQNPQQQLQQQQATVQQNTQARAGDVQQQQLGTTPFFNPFQPIMSPHPLLQPPQQQQQQQQPLLFGLQQLQQPSAAGNPLFPIVLATVPPPLQMSVAGNIPQRQEVAQQQLPGKAQQQQQQKQPENDIDRQKPQHIYSQSSAPQPTQPQQFFATQPQVQPQQQPQHFGNLPFMANGVQPQQTNGYTNNRVEGPQQLFTGHQQLFGTQPQLSQFPATAQQPMFMQQPFGNFQMPQQNYPPLNEQQLTQPVSFNFQHQQEQRGQSLPSPTDAETTMPAQHAYPTLVVAVPKKQPNFVTTGSNGDLHHLDKAIYESEKKPGIKSTIIKAPKILPGGAMPGTCPRQPGWEPCISKDVANERFRNCCFRLGEGCAQICSYDSVLANIQLAVLTGRCPVSKVGDVMICASGNEDATACCAAFGVLESGYEHCRPYCNPSAGLPDSSMLAEKYRCLSKLTQIQRCFYLSQREQPR